jgi:hypothetical protein
VPSNAIALAANAPSLAQKSFCQASSAAPKNHTLADIVFKYYPY